MYKEFEGAWYSVRTVGRVQMKAKKVHILFEVRSFLWVYSQNPLNCSKGNRKESLNFTFHWLMNLIAFVLFLRLLFFLYLYSVRTFEQFEQRVETEYKTLPSFQPTH